MNYDSCLTNAVDLRMNSLLQLPGGPNIGHHLEDFIVLLPLSRESLCQYLLQQKPVIPSRCLANELPPFFVALPAFRASLPSRCLAMRYSLTLLPVVFLVHTLA